ncbi:MAG: VOC family protein [Chloroflexi bacterium]|nr:VOC family protein [Chloroflexota bacterium]
MKIKKFLCDNAAVVNLDEAVAFFRDKLGAKVGPEMPFAPHFGARAKGIWLGEEEPYRLELIESVNPAKGLGKHVAKLAPRYFILSLEVEDLDECIRELRAKGVRTSDKDDLSKVYGLGFEHMAECQIYPQDSCGLGIELTELKGKRPAPNTW